MADVEIPPPPPGFKMEELPPPPPGFTITGGGAAFGNPNIQRQGERALRPDVSGTNPLAAIGGAGGVGAFMGYAAPEILNAAAVGARALPAPISNLSVPLQFMSNAARSAGRPASAIAGAVSGVTSETAGQFAEGAGASQPVAEGARLVAGGVGGESINAAKAVLQKYALVPALGLASKFKHEGVKVLLDKLNAGVTNLSTAEKKLVEDVTNEIRGGAKTDASLENVGSIMGAEGQRLMSQSELQMAQALRQAGTVGGPSGYPATEKTMADIGGELQGSILKRNEAALAARSEQFKATQQQRDALVNGRESAGSFVNSVPEYEAVINDLKTQLDNTGVMKHSSSVQDSYKQILNDLTNPEKDVFGQNKPISFKALDEVRRKLGESFRGKPEQGYGAIDETLAKDLYSKVRQIQVKFAGGESGPQAKLLEDYHASTPGLEIFSSKLGKKVTALDQYREGQYPDPSAIPSAFFKTRASIKALQELTGNKTQVESAALEFANKELAGKDSAAVKEWIGKNSEWLSETGATRSLVDKYATRLEGSERSMRNAQDFAKQAERDSNLLVGKALPAQRAVDLIKSGDSELWSKITPVIAKSPQAKNQMVAAVRQVVADQASTKSTSDLFNRNIRGFLENADIATKQEMDAISSGLQRIQTLQTSEQQKLGMAKRLVLNSIGGYVAGGASRSALGGYGLIADMVPQ